MNPPSARNQISDDQKTENRVMAGFAAVSFVFSVWLCTQALPQAWNGRPAAWLVLVFPLVTLGLLRALWLRRRRRLRYGDARLVLTPFPPRLGSQFTAHVDLKVPFRAGLRYSAHLQCRRRHDTRIGDDRHYSESVEWATSARAQVQAQGEGVRLQWQLQAPPGLPASGGAGADGGQATGQPVYWRLEVRDDTDAQGYQAHFGLEMQAAAAQQGEDGAPVDEGGDLAQAAAALGGVCTVSPGPGGGALLEQPAGRTWRAQRIFILSGLLIGVPLFLSVAMAAAPVLRAGASLAVALLVAWALFAVGNRRISYLHAQQGIRMERRLLGLRTSFVQRPAQQVQQLAIRLAYTQSLGNGPREEVYTLCAQLQGGRTVTLADSLSGKPAAQQALREVARLSGFSAAPV